jgi:hypothetical protein
MLTILYLIIYALSSLAFGFIIGAAIAFGMGG